MNTRRSILIVLLVAFAATMAGCSADGGKGTGGTVLARVNGEPVTLEQLNYRMKFLNLGFTNMSAGPDESNDAGLEALSQLIEETMFLNEAAGLGISVSQSDVEARLNSVIADYPEDIFDRTLARARLSVDDLRKDITRKLTIEKLIETAVYSHVQVSDDEIARYFKEHKSEFSRPLQVRARQIVVEDEALARSIYDELAAGADFEKLARERSLSPDSEFGGDLGYFGKGEMPPEFEEIVFNLKPGQLSSVVQTPYGYHIFKVEDTRKPLTPKLEDSRAAVRQRIAAVRGEADYRDWLEDLKGRYTIELEPGALGRI